MNNMNNDNSDKAIASAPSIAFTGSGSDYFLLWVTNIFLTIITLGIYSAWATVRTRKFFYQHTKLFGYGFDFHAKPMQILKSRVIAVVLYVAYAVLSQLAPVIGIVLLLVFYLALPQLILLSLRFRMANTSFRGLRFSFAGKTGEAYITYLLIPIATSLSLGLVLPYLSYQAYRYWLTGIRYGNQPFTVNLSANTFFIIYLKLLGILAAAFLVIGGLLGVLLATIDIWLLAFLPLVLLLVAVLVARPYLSARITNHVYSNTHVGSLQFQSDLRFWGLLWLTVTNFIMVMVSFGLLTPLTKIRSARYLAERITASAETPLDDMVAGIREKSTATGDEVAELFDIDVPAIG